MNENIHINVFKYGYILLGILTAIGFISYGVENLIIMPQVGPDTFVPNTLENIEYDPSHFGIIQEICGLLCTFSFLPVTIMFTIKQYNKNPYALVFTGCLSTVSSLIYILNGLPILAAAIYPLDHKAISPDILLYLTQIGAIRFLSYDVAGFTLIYIAFLIYGIVYYQTHKWLLFTVIVSIVLFISNVPFLWFIPNMAVILMVLSIFALAPVPIFLAKEAIK